MLFREGLDVVPEPGLTPVLQMRPVATQHPGLGGSVKCTEPEIEQGGRHGLPINRETRLGRMQIAWTHHDDRRSVRILDSKETLDALRPTHLRTLEVHQWREIGSDVDPAVLKFALDRRARLIFRDQLSPKCIEPTMKLGHERERIGREHPGGTRTDRGADGGAGDGCDVSHTRPTPCLDAAPARRDTAAQGLRSVHPGTAK